MTPTSGIAAASTRSIVSGTLAKRVALSATSSAYVWYDHPQTRSPTLRSVTPSPVATTVPDTSRPMIAGKCNCH